MSVNNSLHISGLIKDVLLFDSDTKVALGYEVSGSRNGFKLTNSSRRLVIRCDKARIQHDLRICLSYHLRDGGQRTG